MAKQDISYKIIDILGTLKESDKHDWTKNIVKVSWNDELPTIDIRNMNISNKIMGKGISLTNQEADKLVEILLENGYGTISDIENALKRKKSFFTIEENIETIDINDMYTIDIK